MVLSEVNRLPALLDFSCQRSDSFEQRVYLLENPEQYTQVFFDFYAIPETEKIDTSGIAVTLNCNSATDT